MFFLFGIDFQQQQKKKYDRITHGKKLYKDLVTGIHLVFDVPASACRKFCVP